MSDWFASVDPVWFAIAVVALSTCSFLGLAALAWGGRAQAREIEALRSELALLNGDSILTQATLEATEVSIHKQTMRLDRMQKMLEAMRMGRAGWGDSLNLTKFNWEKPKPF